MSVKSRPMQNHSNQGQHASCIPFHAALYSGGGKESTCRLRRNTETAKAQVEFPPAVGLGAGSFNDFASSEPDASAGRGFVVDVWSRRTGFLFAAVEGCKMTERIGGSLQFSVRLAKITSIHYCSIAADDSSNGCISGGS